MFNQDEKSKLKRVIEEGSVVMREVEDLNAGLADTVKAVAEEMDIKATVLKRAIKIAHKAEHAQYEQDHELLETILATIENL